MTPWIFAVFALWFVQSMLATSIRYLGNSAGLGASLGNALGPRDAPPPMPVLGARAGRAFTNLSEAMPIFLGLAILLEIHGVAAGAGVVGAAVFLTARVLYVAAYLSGIPGIRSTLWMVGHGGLAVMGWAAWGAAG